MDSRRRRHYPRVASKVVVPRDFTERLAICAQTANGPEWNKGPQPPKGIANPRFWRPVKKASDARVTRETVPDIAVLASLLRPKKQRRIVSPSRASEGRISKKSGNEARSPEIVFTTSVEISQPVIATKKITIGEYRARQTPIQPTASITSEPQHQRPDSSPVLSICASPEANWDRPATPRIIPDQLSPVSSDAEEELLRSDPLDGRWPLDTDESHISTSAGPDAEPRTITPDGVVATIALLAPKRVRTSPEKIARAKARAAKRKANRVHSRWRSRAIKREERAEEQQQRDTERHASLNWPEGLNLCGVERERPGWMP